MAADTPETTNQPEKPKAEGKFKGTLPEKKKRKAAGSDDLVGVNIRLTKEMWQALKFAAWIKGKPQAVLVREWIAPELEKYAKKLEEAKEQDEEQAGEPKE